MVGNKEYYVAAAADEIVMPEGGWLMLKGDGGRGHLLQEGLFDKLGVKVDSMQVGEVQVAPASRSPGPR